MGHGVADKKDVIEATIEIWDWPIGWLVGLTGRCRNIQHGVTMVAQSWRNTLPLQPLQQHFPTPNNVEVTVYVGKDTKMWKGSCQPYPHRLDKSLMCCRKWQSLWGSWVEIRVPIPMETWPRSNHQTRPAVETSNDGCCWDWIGSGYVPIAVCHWLCEDLWVFIGIHYSRLFWSTRPPTSGFVYKDNICLHYYCFWRVGHDFSNCIIPERHHGSPE